MRLRLLLLIPALAIGCRMPDAAGEKAAPFEPALSIRPLAVGLIQGSTQTFQAEANLPGRSTATDPAVRWSVVEPGGGTITAEGLYTAPRTPGTFHVQAQRMDFPGVTATATVRVR